MQKIGSNPVVSDTKLLTVNEKRHTGTIQEPRCHVNYINLEAYGEVPLHPVYYYVAFSLRWIIIHKYEIQGIYHKYRHQRRTIIYNQAKEMRFVSY